MVYVGHLCGLRRLILFTTTSTEVVHLCIWESVAVGLTQTPGVLSLPLCSFVSLIHLRKNAYMQIDIYIDIYLLCTKII